MGKQKKIRGTKPTLIQRKILNQNHMDPEQFMFVKEVIKEQSPSNGKSLGRNSSKLKYLQFVHRVSGDIIELEGI